MLKQKAEAYLGFRTPGIRLTEELLPDVVEHRTDRVLVTLYAIHAFDKAHLVMLAEEKLIPLHDAVAMLRVLRDTEREGIEKARLDAGGGMHSGEQLLIRRLSEEVGGRIHLGRSSGDFGAVSTKIVQRDKMLDVMLHLNNVRSVMISQADAHVATVMPGYTHGQHAQPTTLGHQLAAWAAVLERDFERAIQAYRRINVSPAGAAILTGSNFPLNRHRTSELLGFDRPAPSTFDAILSHDTELDSFCVLAILNADLARWADDLMLWSTSEFSMVDVPDRFCGTSSIMMQKKNPYAPQYIKGLGAASLGGLVTAFHAERGPTGMPILDRQYSRDALWQLYDDTVRDLKWVRALLPALRWNKTLMRARAGEYWAQATDIAGALVREKGLPWRTAHQIVGILVRLGYERGFGPSDVTPALLDEAAVAYMDRPVHLSEESLRKAVDPENFVGARSIFGGPAPEEVLRRLADFRAALTRDDEVYQEVRRQVAGAHQKLESAIDALVAITQ